MAVVLSGPGAPKRARVRFSGSMAVRAGAAVSAGAFLFSAWFLFLGARDYSSMDDARTEWREMADVASGDAHGAQDGFVALEEGLDGVFYAPSGQSVYESDDELFRAVDLEALRAVNPDVSGYIRIPGTQVDYPVLQEQEPGTYFYIDHNMSRKPDKYGSIFELHDSEKGVNSPITWVFGHHMQSGAMFSSLYNFLDEDLAATPVYLYRDGWRCEYRAFGACILKETDGLYAFGDYTGGSEAYSSLLDRLRELNRMPDTGVPWADSGDDIVVLSTCYGRAGTSDRIVVLCREVRRAVTPEYYASMLEVQEYGGSRTPMTDEEIAELAPGVDRDGQISSIPGMTYPDVYGDDGSGQPVADGEEPSDTDAVTDPGTALPDIAPGDHTPGLESSMAGLLGGG